MSGHRVESTTAVDGEQVCTLAGLFATRVSLSPDKIACYEFDASVSEWRGWRWEELSRKAAHWQRLFAELDIAPGERVALLHPNSHQWICLDQAALGLGLVVVPLYMEDRAANARYILSHSNARVLVVHDLLQWQRLEEEVDNDDSDSESALDKKWRPQHVIITGDSSPCNDTRVLFAAERLMSDERAGDKNTSPSDAQCRFRTTEEDGDALATIVYTSGTTGRPKGVMLSNANIVANIKDCLQRVTVYPSDRFLSFLPLSHTLERTVGYYMVVMAGAEIVYNRAIDQLADELRDMQPTVLISVPRIFERVYDKLQSRLQQGAAWRRALFNLTVYVGWRRFLYRQGRATRSALFFLWPLLQQLVAKKITAALGGQMRIAVSGGAPIPFHVARTFLALGVEICQGYGLTEASPVLSSNAPDENHPQSVGKPLASVRLRIGDDDELQAAGPNIMQGYWRDEIATQAVISEDGWLGTGDCARLQDGFVYITGRLKDILVLSNGEKVPPADMESAISEDVLFEQVIVIGEGRPFLAALVVLDAESWQRIATDLGLSFDDEQALCTESVEKILVERIAQRMRHFPGYARIHRVSASLQPWSVQNGLLTPTMKPKRKQILAVASAEVERLYAKPTHRA